MTTFRSRRLEVLLGSRIEDVTHAQVGALVTNQVPEAFDLDFKGQLYGRADSDKRDLATDVAAPANTAGGLVVLGIEEDAQARAVAAPGIQLSDGERNRMLQIIASLVAPLPDFEILPVEDPAKPGTGFYLIAANRSTRQPHAVLINDGFRYPRRNGATTRYLSEAEVAAAYRDRFASAAAQVERADKIEWELINRLATDGLPWLVLSLVPDLPGDLVIDTAALRAFRAEVSRTNPMIAAPVIHFENATVGRRRLLADGGTKNGKAYYLASELHSDGAGAFGVVLLDLNEGKSWITEDNREQQIEDESLVLGLLSGIRHLAKHARDRATAGGGALVRAQLFHGENVQAPLRFGHRRGLMNMGVLSATRRSSRR